MSTPRVVYIAGRMHCGSTFLGALLGAAPHAVGLGEPINGLRPEKADPCACGESVDRCAFWSTVARDYASATGHALRDDAGRLYRVADIRRFAAAWRSPGAEPWSWYRSANHAFVEAAATGETRYVVDSGKEFTRALLILAGEPDARVIHLVRDPVNTVASYYWRQTVGSRFYFMKRSYDVRWMRFPALMLVALSWNAGVLLGWLLGRRWPGRVLHVSYERFCDDPPAQLARIAAFTGMDLEGIISSIATARPVSLGHNLGGNAEIKGDGEFVFVPNAKGRRRMPAAYRWGTALLTLPGRILAGLLRFDGGAAAPRALGAGAS